MKKSEVAMLAPLGLKARDRDVLSYTPDLAVTSDLHSVLDDVHRLHMVATAIGVSVGTVVQEVVWQALDIMEKDDPRRPFMEEIKEELNSDEQSLCPDTFPWAIHAHLMGVPIVVFQHSKSKTLAVAELFQRPDGNLDLELTSRLREALNRSGLTYRGTPEAACLTKYSFLGDWTDVTDSYYAVGRSLLGQWFGSVRSLHNVHNARELSVVMLTALTGYSPRLVRMLAENLPPEGILAQFSAIEDLGPDIPKLLAGISDDLLTSRKMSLRGKTSIKFDVYSSPATRRGIEAGELPFCVHTELSDGECWQEHFVVHALERSPLFDAYLEFLKEGGERPN